MSKFHSVLLMTLNRGFISKIRQAAFWIGSSNNIFDLVFFPRTTRKSLWVRLKKVLRTICLALKTQMTSLAIIGENLRILSSRL